MPRVILGAAHTLMQPGEVYKDLREADITRKMLSLAVPHLEKSGIEFKTVPLDLPLLQRIDWINKAGYTEEENDIFIELHVNDGGKRGVETWYQGDPSEFNKSQRLAEFFIDEFCAKMSFTSQEAKSEHDHELTSLLILNQTKPIAIAAELLYIDNEEDIKILKDEKKLDDMMKTLVDVIKEFFEDLKSNPPKADPNKKTVAGVGNFGNLPKFDNLPSLSGSSSSSNSSDSNGNKKSPLLMDREERKKMITDVYKKILGEEPSQADLNKHLNLAVAEDQLIDELINGEKHKKIVEDAKKLSKVQEEHDNKDLQVKQQASELNDLKAMLDNLNKLLAHKNQAIQYMQNELVRNGVVVKGEYFDPHRR